MGRKKRNHKEKGEGTGKGEGKGQEKGKVAVSEPARRAMPESEAVSGQIDYGDLRVGAGCNIELTEHRAITMKQLDALSSHVWRRCKHEKWVDRSLGSPTYGQMLAHATINLYQVVDWVVKPATEQTQVSFVELVADGPQPPKWFISHWWGEAVMDFIRCLVEHSRRRSLNKDSPYWVCAYANNQWQLGEDVTADPAQSSFRKAMKIADGTVQVIDAGAVCYTRVWCSYEVFVSLTDEPKLYDVTTVAEWWEEQFMDSFSSIPCVREAVAILDNRGYSIDLNGFAKRKAEEGFPKHIAVGAMSSAVQNAKASVETDRRHILNSIIGAADLEAQPPVSHDSYDEINLTLKGRFAAALWRNALKARDADRATWQFSDFPMAVQRCGLKSWSLDLEDVNVHDEDIATIVEAFERTLGRLHLNFKRNKLTATGITNLLAGLSRLDKLHTLDLNLALCAVTDELAELFSKSMPPSLTELKLNVDTTNVTEVGLNAIRSAWKPRRTESLRIISGFHESKLTAFLTGNDFEDFLKEH